MNNLSSESGTNWLIFPSLAVASFTLAYLLHQPLLYLITGYFILFLCYKKQLVLLLAVLFCSFFVWWRIQQVRPPIATKTQTVMLHVVPDSIEITGEQVSFDAYDEQERLIRGFYYEKDLELQQKWQQRALSQTTFLAKGSLALGRPQRNRHGFDYQKYLDQNGYAGVIQISKIIKYGPAQNHFPFHTLRSRFLTHLENSFPKHLATYILALVAGHKSEDFEALRAVFSTSGILHLFSISGMHVLTMMLFFNYGLRRLGFTIFESFLPLLILLGTLIFLFGSSLSVWRAALLFFVQLLLKTSGQKRSAVDCFAVVLFLLLLIDPFALLQVSGQLSLLLSWVLICQSHQELGRFWQTQWVSWLILPLILSLFYQTPLIGGLMTYIFLPICQYLWLPLFSFLALSSLVLPMPTAFLQFLTWCLEQSERVLTFVGQFHWTIGKPPLFVDLICIILALICYQQRRWGLSLLFCLVLPIFITQLSLPTLIAFVDVGQGDAILFKAPFKKEVVLIDTGGKVNFFNTPMRANAQTTLLPLLQGEGINQIDTLVLTHGDTDHMGDVLELTKTIKIKEIILAKGSQQHPNLQKMLQQLPKQTNIRLVTSGQQIGNYFQFRVLAPDEESAGENEDSLVLHTTIDNKNFLLTGDLGIEGERKLVQKYPQMSVDVLKLGHHGSRTSSDLSFLQTLKPEAAIISCGLNNRFNHPHEEVLANLATAQVPYYRTDLQGMIYYEFYPWQKIGAIQFLHPRD
ncbi:MAG: DNA internalization-related competence protein ComEC/Rec2 [Enterococcus sp.]